VEVILGAEDLRSLTDRVEYVRAVMDSDSYLLRSIEATRVQVAERRNRVSDQEALLSKHRDAIRREVDRIAELKAEQEAMRAEVDTAIAERERLLGGVEENRQQYVQAVRELEAESERIAGVIRGGGSSGDGNPGAQLFWPAPGPITSGFGWRVHPIFGTRRFHAGVDIDADCGDPIWAAARGNVLSAGWNGGYGNATVIDHGNGLATLYAHQESIGVAVGQRVGRGQQIGSVGTTGWSTGCHLHFEVRINGTPVDPEPYLT
ncbi:MAG TPA: peptidoglycan DD-metalloendopeptidase family protein, partial [Actinomycetota bacterium]|nr:peptidoglycan DD-metalloendopeptidase family protein [Actinomycetota bacterium]